MAEGPYASWGWCSLPECAIDRSIFQYRPSLAANSTFIALFGVSLIIHVYEAIKWRQRMFGTLMAMGCVCEMIGYGGRIIEWNDPWSFNGFMLQIVCITIAPVFITAAIYIQLYKSVLKLSPESALFRPSLYFQLFIPCDIVSLVLQAVGGAMSSESNGSGQMGKNGVNIGLAGLSFQVVCLLVFIVLSLIFAWTYRRNVRAGRASTANLDGRFKLFLAFLTLATVTVFMRCAYRIYELNDGYGGPAIHDQTQFIALEGCMIVIATFALNVGHPGLVFDPRKSVSKSPASEAVEERIHETKLKSAET